MSWAIGIVGTLGGLFVSGYFGVYRMMYCGIDAAIKHPSAGPILLAVCGTFVISAGITIVAVAIGSAVIVHEKAKR
jgi:hypothetical protein